ncbi:hypothetical protein [Erwinia sp. 198]|uniref:hypothetical protein n=1 Tax=Erwinia sp. 198 TaxID=2022746 RepID=UPI003516EA0B
MRPDTRSGASCTDSGALIAGSCVGGLEQKRPDENALLVDHYTRIFQNGRLEDG